MKFPKCLQLGKIYLIPICVIIFAFCILSVYQYQNSFAFVSGQLATTVLGWQDFSHGLSQSLFVPRSMVFDSAGNLWVADGNNNRVLMYPKGSGFTNGESATVVLGQPNLSSRVADDGGVTANSLNNPTALSFDSSGNLWVADASNSRVLMYPQESLGRSGSPATVVLGQTVFTSSNTGTTANTLNIPTALSFDTTGNLWVVDDGNNRVLMYPKASLGSSGSAATAVLGQTLLTTGGSGTTATTLLAPHALSFDTTGNLWVVDGGNNRVLMYPQASLGISGSAATVVLGQTLLTLGGSGTTATTLTTPNALSFDSTGNLWVVDGGNNRVLMYPQASLGSSGSAATVVLGQTLLTTGGSGTTATALKTPNALSFDSTGNLWVGDGSNNRVLMYPQASLGISGSAATVVLGQTDFTSGSSGTTANMISGPTGLSFDSTGNLWVVDGGNNRVLMYPKGSGFTNGESATVVLGQTNLTSSGSGTTATTLFSPNALSFDTTGNLWVVDGGNNRVLMYPKASLGSSGSAATVVLGQTLLTTGGSGTTAITLKTPISLSFDTTGNLWVADYSNNRVLMYPKASLGISGSAATVVLGQTLLTSGGFDTNATTLFNPNALSFDTTGNLWVADANNNRVLMYPKASLGISGSAATIVLGQTDLTSSGFGTTDTSLFGPNALSFDTTGNLWVGDGSNNRVLMYPKASLGTNGSAATIVLGQTDFVSGGSDTTPSTLTTPTALSFDSTGNLWVVDDGNNRVLKHNDLPSSTLVFSTNISSGTNTFSPFATAQVKYTSIASFPDASLVVQKYAENPTQSDPPGNVVGNFYDMETNSPDLLTSRSITLFYNDAQATGLSPSSFHITRFSGGSWSTLSSQVNMTAHTVTALTPGFSTYVITGSLSSTSSSGGFGGSNPIVGVGPSHVSSGGICNTNAFGDRQSLQVYDIKYDKCVTHQINVTANSLCGAMSVQIGILHGSSEIAALSPTQPFKDRLLFTAPIDPSAKSFTVSATNIQNNIVTDVITNQCTGEVNRNFTMTSSGTSGSASLSSTSSIYTQSTQENKIPNWVKNNAKWWSEGQVEDSDFVKAMQYLIQQEIVKIPQTQSGKTQSQQIPSWIKSNAGWWASGQISDDEFVKGIQWLIANGIIVV